MTGAPPKGTQLAADAPSAGPPRRSASAVHEQHGDRLVMAFGGDGQQFFADTWAYDLAEQRWYQLPG